MTLEVSLNLLQILAEFAIFAILAMFVKNATFQNTPLDIFEFWVFTNPRWRFFVRLIIFVRFAIFAEFRRLYQGRLLTYHLNFRQPSSKCPPYLLFSSNVPLFKRPIQNMHAAPSLISYAFESFPTYYNQHNYAIPQVIPQVVVLVRSFVCFCNSFFARIASLIIVWPTISPETSQKRNVD